MASRTRITAFTPCCLAALLALGACSKGVDEIKAPVPESREHTLNPLGEQASSASAASNSSSASAPTDRWTGQWNGPEGTFLRLSGGQGRYDITIQDLDGPRQYTGRAVGDHIAFERQGNTETLRATDGRATGMKWLDGKRDCLTVRAGEGYCRD
ncbi:hypothetical protein EIP75_11820 [Aquabacterium soli]|uniref:Lipoprotein n=1 Tax=Aquabacterium soli TaxID=2493092 RepID=A0A426VAV2_9BURK|nr:hypothetical protein [Aquabacterium soli]RRS04069.1 hypothetical protein EIP75_11820 [Aquabacterium soli]